MIQDKQEVFVNKLKFNRNGDIVAWTRDGQLTCYQGILARPHHKPSIKYVLR